MSDRNSRGRNKRIITMDDLKREDEQGDDQLYVGGSEHSGQAVLGPHENPMFSDIIHRAQQMEMTEAEGSATKVFLWRNGFSIGDDGELREIEVPANRAFIQSLASGIIPSELRNPESPDYELDISLHDRRDQDYPTDRPMRPFSGTGHLLGSPVPPIRSSSADAATGTTSLETLQNQANQFLRDNGGEGNARVAIRLPSGQRIVLMMDPQRHTVHSLRELIVSLMPNLLVFSLCVAGVGGKLVEITDDSATIEDAKLAGSLVTVKIKDANAV